MTILIADDSEFIRETLVKLLKTVDSVQSIYLAKDVKEASDLLEQFDFDIIVLDIRMPKGQGFDVLRYAKNKDKKPVVIMLTNYAIEQYKNKSLSMGADYFLDKSSDFEKIIDIIDIVKSKTAKQ